MKKRIGSVASSAAPSVALALALSAACAEGVGDEGQVVLSGGNAEVVIAPRAPKAVGFAACEMTNFLSRVFGRAVPVVTKPTDGRMPIFLGANPWNDGAGVTTNGLVRDAFRVRIGRDGVRIVGIDDRAGEGLSAKISESGMPVGFSETERATLFGVYEFLERYAGVRMYFPGELGEVVPRRDELRLPVTEFTVAPEFTVRNVYMQGDGKWYEPAGKDPLSKPAARKALSWARLRLQTEYIPCCHGQCRTMFVERFGKSHPEYFALQKGPDGKMHRDCDPIMRGTYQTPDYFYLCQTSAVWDELYEDAASYLRGEPASVRRVPVKGNPNKFAWGGNMRGGKYVDVMCEDGFRKCACEKCQAAYDDSQPGGQYATELIWNQTIRLANRLKAAGIPGYVTQMAYGPYHNIPKADIPDNLLVMVATAGPWSNGNPKKRAKDDKSIRDWAEKCGHKVWIWNYITKWGAIKLPGVPQMTPKAIGSYYPDVAPYIFGAFAESGSDKAIYQYLNYYVFAKLCWNTKIDVGALLDEHYRLMFGAAAPEVREFYESLEEKWLGIMSNTVETPRGPITMPPDERTLGTVIYSDEVVAGYNRLFDRGMSKVPAGSIEARRLAFIRREFVDPLHERAVALSVEHELKLREGRENRSVIDNGDFETLDGWRFEKTQGDGSMSIDKETFVSGAASLKVTMSNHVSVVQSIPGKIVPGRKYRLSYFLKTKDMVPLTKYSQVFTEFYNGTWQFFPRGGTNMGTSDWFHRSYTFTAIELPKDPKPPIFRFFISGCKGTFWIDGLRVEEIQGEGK